ncbi:MAG: protecting protein DprA protein [candidate division TM6 bacterium GW2011_GWF2_37_49]|nr:MAG: protecting protein DprA protein [candidate division TM6 bacterium GW2011_GWF2_37_49]
MSYNNNSQILLHLSLIGDVGPNTLFRLLKKMMIVKGLASEHLDYSDLIGKKYNIDLGALYKYSVIDFINEFEILPKYAELIEAGLRDDKALETELCLLEQSDIKIVSIFDEYYPENLRHIHCPPTILYYSGEKIDTDLKSLAIVGSRKADDYAWRVIQSIVPTMVANGWSITSGGALGADTIAHEVALDCGGKTIAVLGSGLMCQYPESNKSLFEQIVKKSGTVVSPFPLKMAPRKEHFPARNRIISGLSQGCLVVQAAAKSGALITANYAMEQGRSVFAIPGRVDDLLSAGCNSLLKQGAKLVCDAGDILEEFGESLSAEFFKPALKLSEKQHSLPISSSHDVVLSKLTSGCTIDELILKTGLCLQELQDLLFQLQLNGIIHQTFTGAWEKCK